VVQPAGTSLNATVFEHVRYADQFPGSDPCIRINSAIGDLPAAGGTVDARGFEGVQTCIGGVNLNKPVRLLLGAATYSWTFNYPIFTITSSGVSIEGLGNMGATTLNVPANTTGIYTARGIVNTSIRHLYIDGPTAGTQSGFAIQIDAAPSPALNSIFMIEDVYVYGGYAGIQAIRPINSSLKDVRVSATVSGGFSFIGDGTTVTCINCYANGDGGDGFTIIGMANVTLVGGEADTNKGDGVRAYTSSSYIPTVGLTLSGFDVESNVGSGVHLIGTGGTSISGSQIISNAQDGIQMCGGSALAMTGGRIGANGRYGVNLAPSGCVAVSEVAILSPLIDLANGTGTSLINDPNHKALSNVPLQAGPAGAAVSMGGASWGSGPGAPSGSCVTGSLYTNLAGAGSTTLYVCESGAWKGK
jgi:hypothetical protein